MFEYMAMTSKNKKIIIITISIIDIYIYKTMNECNLNNVIKWYKELQKIGKKIN